MADFEKAISATVQELEVPKDFTKLQTPNRCIISGPTCSGKSRLIVELIKHRDTVYSATFERVIVALPDDAIHQQQEFISSLKEACETVEIVEGLPNIQDLHLTADASPSLLVLDDLMLEAFNDNNILALMTKHSHHSK